MHTNNLLEQLTAPIRVGSGDLLGVRAFNLVLTLLQPANKLVNLIRTDINAIVVILHRVGAANLNHLVHDLNL